MVTTQNKEEIKNLTIKARSQQKQWKRPSNQVIEDMLDILERMVN